MTAERRMHVIDENRVVQNSVPRLLFQLSQSVSLYYLLSLQLSYRMKHSLCPIQKKS